VRSRRQNLDGAPDAADPPPPHRIDATAVYTRAAAQAALGLNRTTLAREIREGRLRVSKRAGRYFLLGEWILEWLRAGEVRRRPAAERNGTH
jgi:hypothetical protein